MISKNNNSNSIKNVPNLRRHILEALRVHGVSPNDVRICLLFGSYARGYARPGSDVDLLLFVREVAPNLPFSYKRFRSGSVEVDSNLIEFSGLDLLCQDQRWNWAYRLYKSIPVAEFSSEAPGRIAKWLKVLDVVIESEEACYNRAKSHVEDLSLFYNLLLRCDLSFSYLQLYFATEILRLVPMAILNICREVPYTKYHPEEIDITGKPGLSASLEKLYKRFLFELKRIELTGDGSLSGLEGRKLRHRIHLELDKKWPNDLGRSYGGLLERTWEDICELDGFLALSGLPGGVVTPGFRGILQKLIHELRRLIAKRASSFKEMSNEISKDTANQKLPGSRLVCYDKNRKRLKGIIPTGGCRVGTCTFCMLPLIGRSKGNVSAFLKEMKEHLTGPVNNVVIYTDGSFFDDRELSDEERLQIGTEVSRLGARELLVETLPRFLSAEKVLKLIKAISPACQLRIGVGIQSMNETVRKYVTRTPITNDEIASLFSLRRQIHFSLRIFLLVGKSFMSRYEDLKDLTFSLQELQNLLAPPDLVTVNPLLSTEGTLVHSLQGGGYFEQMTKTDFLKMVAGLYRSAWPFNLELGPVSASSCSSQSSISHALNECAYVSSDDLCPFSNDGKVYDYKLGPGLIPWSLLGGYQSRGKWASKLTFLQKPSD